MGLLFRLLFWLLLLLILAAAGIWVGRGMVAEYIIQRGLAGAGIENADFNVETLSGNLLIVKDLKVGPKARPGLDLETLEVSYDWRTLWREKQVNSVVVGPGSIRMKMDDAGTISIAGVPTRAGNNNQSTPFDPSALPLNDVEIHPITFDLETPEGVASGTIAGAYDVSSGGNFSFDATTDKAGPNGIAINDAQLSGTLDLKANGATSLATTMLGNITTPAYAVSDINIAIEGTGSSWIEYIQNGVEGFFGEAVIDIRSAQFPLVPTGDMPPNQLTEFARTIEPWLGEDPLEWLQVSGTLRGEFSAQKFDLYFMEQNPFKLLTNANDEVDFKDYASDEGVDNPASSAVLTLTDQEIEFGIHSLFNTRTLEFAFNFTGRQAYADGAISFVSDFAFPEQDIYIPGSDIQLLGVRTQQELRGDIRADTININSAGPISFTTLTLAVGTINNFSSLPRFELNYSEAVKSLRIAALAAGSCPKLNRALIALEEDALFSTIENVEICPLKDKTFAVLSLDTPPSVEFNAAVSAQSIDYTQAELTVSGAPPALEVGGTYAPDAQTLTTKGTYTGGNLVLNDTLRLSRAQGDLDATLIGTDMVSKSNLSTIRIEQADTDNIMISPVIGNGRLTYEQGIATYEAMVSTPHGTLMGSGKGTHSIETGIGNLDIDFEDLVFLPDGLQPDAILPPLIGIIKDTNGAMTGSAKFAWSPEWEKIKSSADIAVQELTFGGPGIAVTQTGGVSGALKLNDLLPITSDGIQTLYIDFIDLNALRLEQGNVSFEFPGDDTLAVTSAEFPWFGGTIGAYDTTAAMTGERAATALKAYDVNLGELLGFLEIDGLSGEGIVEGELPLIVEDGKISIENGILAADGPGVIRFDSAATRQAADTSEQAEIAFGILRELKFNTLEARIDGPLDGDVTINLVFEGINDIDFQGQMVPTPVIYRIKLDAPLSNLIYQGQLTTDYVLQRQIIDGVIQGQVKDGVQEN